MTEERRDGARIVGGPLSGVDEAIRAHRVEWIVSAINKDTMLKTPAGILPERHLKLAMNDISTAQTGLVIPSESHVASLIEFVDGWDMQAPMLVHCWAGVSRSTASIYIALCRLNEAVSEEKIARLLRQASPTATPNVRLISLADDFLGRGGRMVDAVKGIGTGEMTFEGRVFSVPARLDEADS